ncbi:MAG: hypothetical protein ALECFALPRED_004911 [Alectoria fallacina]|uniref:Uncharacterized protein n=1 Tax=Alectoria fallacina TaxID=1903189 RepID=A0A8H3ER44_9LECA|nr:MAG: hypothetical protein ALECFALPRED_004911 [Alectoria fallacina]
MLLCPSLLAALSLLAAIPLPTYGASILCAENLYGKPLLSDAVTISNNLPYVKLDPDHQMDAGRIFAEPAFFTPKFQGLLNTWDSAMVQLPRVWRYRSARIALLFYANAAGKVPLPSINSNWRVVQAATAGVVQYCIKSQQGVGGVWIVTDHTQTPYLSLFLYESGAPFEDVVNRYMITGLGVNPFNPRGFGIEGVALNSTGVLGTVEDQAELMGNVAATAGIGAEPSPAASVVAALRGELGVQ